MNRTIKMLEPSDSTERVHVTSIKLCKTLILVWKFVKQRNFDLFFLPVSNIQFSVKKKTPKGLKNYHRGSSIRLPSDQ